MAIDFNSVNQLCISTFGTTATLFSQDGGEQTIEGIIAPPPMLEEQLPTSLSGVTNVYFFVNLEDVDPCPKRGDTFDLNGVRYDLVDILIDSAGGSTLKGRRNA